MAERFDKIHRNIIKLDNKLIVDLFNVVGAMNINEIRQFTLIEQIPYTVIDVNGNTLIHRVLLENNILKTENQRLQVIKYLYNENVNPDAPNNMNYTPLHIACMKQYKSIIEYLVSIGVDINYKDNFGNTPLHKLFTGNIKLEEKTSSGNIIPYPKKKDRIKTAEWKVQRTLIWKNIKDSPFIKAIDNTLKDSISIMEHEELDRLRYIQEELSKINKDTSIINRIGKSKELQDASVNEFKKIIYRKWGNFASISDIMIHTTTPNSFPTSVTGLSVIRNADTKIYINTLINTQIDNITTLLSNRLTNPDMNINNIIGNMFDIFMLDIQQTLFDTRIFNNNIHGIINLGQIGPPAFPDQLFDTITDLHTIVDNNNLSIVDKYNEFNNTYAYNGTFDFADNVIDLDNMTFIGGARTIQMSFYFTLNNFIRLYNGTRDHIIPKLVYMLFSPIDNSFTFDGEYNIEVIPFKNNVAQLIVSIIDGYDDINRLLLIIQQQIRQNQATLLQHNNLIPLLNRDIINRNYIKWIYCFCNKFLENEKSLALNNGTLNLDDLITSSPLLYDMRMGIVLLTAGLINEKSDLLLSISQSIRSTLYNEIICNVTNNIYGFGDNNLQLEYRVGSIVSAWLYLLFSTQQERYIIYNINGRPDRRNILVRQFLNSNDTIHDHINYIITNEEQLGNIMLYAYDVMNNLTITNMDELIGLQLLEIDTGDNITNLCNMISKYYNMMEQPPQMLHVADIIALIRKKTLGNYQDLLNILYNYQIEIRIFGRLQTNEAGNMNTFAEVQDLIDPNLNLRLALEKTRNNMFLNITDDNNGFNDMIYIINEYALPSRVNYYLYNYFNRDNDVNNDTILYVLKFIESYYLGLNFFGHLQFVYIKSNIIYTYQQPYIRSRQVQFYTPNNLFNFYNMNQDIQWRYIDNPIIHPGPILNLLPPPDIIKYNLHNTLLHNELYRPTTIMSVAEVLSTFERNINRILNYLLESLRTMFNKFKETKRSGSYGTVITELYPMIYNLTEYSNKFVPLNNKINTEYREVITDLSNIRSPNIVIPNITTELNKFNLFNLNTLEKHINNINGYIFILYYTSTNTDNIKIPKFIYHSLGSKFKPLVVYNYNEDLNLTTPVAYTLEDSVNTKIIDNMNGSYNKNIALFRDVINNVNFINKQILTNLYITSKKSKLPPSLGNVLNQFYRFNVIELIRNNRDILSDNIITIENLNKPMKDIQLLYLKAKMIEEILSLYFKNKVNQYTIEYYNRKVRLTQIPIPTPTPIQNDLELEQVYNDINNNFIIELNKEPSQLVLDYITNSMANRNILRLFYSFVEKKNNNKEQFYIYPDNYFGTNLLNNKYVININNNIIDFMLQNGANIMLHNNEKLSPLLMFIKNYYYKGLQNINKYININDYNDDTNSPFNYLFRVFKNHLDLYNDKFIDNMYNEVIQIIQSNDLYYNNVLKYVETSFKTVKYLTEQFLTETMLKFSDEYKNTDLIDILKIFEIFGFDINSMTDMMNITYNMKLGNGINIHENDDGIVIQNLLDNLTEKITTRSNLREKYNITLQELLKLRRSLTDIDADIATNELSIMDLTNKRVSLDTILEQIPYQTTTVLTNACPKIIDRYNRLLQNMNNNHLCYMDGWRQLHNIDRHIIDRLPQYLVDYLNSNENYKNMYIILLLHKSYKNTYNIIKEYFENPKFISENKILGFVYDVLIHLTKTFICSNIESIIKTILYDFLINTESIPITIKKINYMFDGIREYLYEDIPKLLVQNSVGILDEKEDEVSGQTASEILNQLILLLQTTSRIEINEYTLNILKNNIIPYFDMITYKLINNWNASIENIFIYHINIYRIMECIVSIQ